MKLLTTLFVLFLGTAVLFAQNETEQKLCGTWEYVGYTYEDSYYPVNHWYHSSLTFTSDYRVELTKKNTLSNQQYHSNQVGKWNVSPDESTLSLFADEERFIANQKVVVYDNSFHLHFFDGNYLELLVDEGDILKIKRFKKVGVTTTFEANYVNYLTLKSQPKVNYSTEEFSVLSGKKLDRTRTFSYNKTKFDVNLTAYYPLPSLQKRTTNFTAKIVDFDENTVTFSVEKKITKEIHTNANTQFSYFTYKEPEIIQIPKENISGIYTPASRTTYRISAIASVVSFATTFIIAPIISYQFSTNSFNKQLYFATAGAGLAGMAIFIPTTILLRKNPATFSDKNGVKKIALKKRIR